MNHLSHNEQHSSFDDQKARKAQQRKASRHYERAMALEQALFDHRSRYLILILTLTYKPEWRPLITFEDIRRDRDHFFDNVRTNKLLNDINGYVAKIEEGGGPGGLHMHIVIFYDGAHRADISIAKSIGEYWKNVITQGRGDYWNSNAQKEEFELSSWGNATGQIDRNDHVKRVALRTYLGQYIAKDDQHVSSRINPHDCTFTTSHFPI